MPCLLWPPKAVSPSPGKVYQVSSWKRCLWSLQCGRWQPLAFSAMVTVSTLTQLATRMYLLSLSPARTTLCLCSIRQMRQSRSQDAGAEDKSGSGRATVSSCWIRKLSLKVFNWASLLEKLCEVERGKGEGGREEENEGGIKGKEGGG